MCSKLLVFKIHVGGRIAGRSGYKKFSLNPKNGAGAVHLIIMTPLCILYIERGVFDVGEEVSMVNVVATHCSLLRWLMKMAGVRPYMLEIEPGTVMRFWVPSHTISKPKKRGEKPELVSKPKKPVVVLIHGFFADGIMTWQLQVGALTREYSVYVPDFLFFGGSFTDKPGRSPAFQAECLAAGLRKLGVEKCVVVGFSYGGMVAFKMGEMYPELVHGIVISGSVVAMKESIISDVVRGVGFSSCSEMLLPNSLEELKALLSLGLHRNIRFPNRIYKDFLEVMFPNRKERDELLEALVHSYKDINIPKFSQRIHLLWGENDKIFKPELAKEMKEKLGNKTTFQGIKKAGHLVFMDRPWVFNRCLKQFLSSI